MPSKKKTKKSTKSTKKAEKKAAKKSGKVSPIPRGCDGVIPHLVVSDAKAALRFYKKAFGATDFLEHPAPDGKRLMHAEFSIDKQRVYLADEFPEFGMPPRNPQALGGSSVTLHQYVPSCDKAIARAEKAGASVTMPPQDMFWGDRYGTVTDPWGHVWSFATRKAKLTPKQMQEAAAQAFAQPQPA